MAVKRQPGRLAYKNSICIFIHCNFIIAHDQAYVSILYGYTTIIYHYKSIIQIIVSSYVAICWMCQSWCVVFLEKFTVTYVILHWYAMIMYGSVLFILTELCTIGWMYLWLDLLVTCPMEKTFATFSFHQVEFSWICWWYLHSFCQHYSFSHYKICSVMYPQRFSTYTMMESFLWGCLAA